MIRKTPNFIIGQYLERNDIGGLAEYARAVIEDSVLDLVEQRAEYDSVFKWLLGEEGEFPESEPGKRYGFRTELRKRIASITEGTA